MRKIVEYFRSIFCKHEYKLLHCADIYDYDKGFATKCIDELPYCRQWTYMCKKCGYVKIVRTDKK